jgi:disulfide oxidoreductase YuzD
MTVFNYAKTVRADQLLTEIQGSAITIAVENLVSSTNSVTITFKADLSGGEVTLLDQIVTDHAPQEILTEVKEFKLVEDVTKKNDADNNLQVTMQPRSGSGVTYMSHNLGDPKSWWMNATKHTDITLSPKVGGVYDVYSFAHELIDTGNGKITFEDRKFDNKGDDYIRPIIKVNETVVSFNPVSIANTYSIDYTNNEITFNPALTVSDVVTATYYSVNDSVCIIEPLAGKKLRIEKVECQFSKNVDFSNRWLVFQPYVYLTAYGTSVAYGEPAIYKDIKDYLNESNNSAFVSIPAAGGLTQDVYNFVWEYPASKDLYYLTNGKLAKFEIYVYDPTTGVKTSPLTAIGGGALELATVTFYCMSEAIA